MSVETSLYSPRAPISAKRLSEIARQAQIELRFLDSEGMPLQSSERIKRPLTRNGFIVIGWDASDEQTTAAVDRSLAARDKQPIDDLGLSGELGWFELSGGKFDYDRSWKRFADERSDFEESIAADVLAKMRAARAMYFFRCGLRPAHCGTLLGRVADIIRNATDAVDPERIRF